MIESNEAQSPVPLLESYMLGEKIGAYLTLAQLQKIGGRDKLREMFCEEHDGSDPIEINDKLGGGEHAWIEMGGDEEGNESFLRKVRALLEGGESLRGGA